MKGKNNMSEEKMKVLIALIIAIATCFIISLFPLYYMHENHVMTKNGYTQTTLQGSSYTKWIKEGNTNMKK